MLFSFLVSFYHNFGFHANKKIESGHLHMKELDFVQ